MKGAPLKSHGKIFDQEVQQAERELERPARGLIVSGLLAGFGLGASVLLLAVVHSLPGLSDPARLLLSANAYAVGFVIVILGSTDLFTEYSTIALLPVLTGDAPLISLGRLWALVFGSNIVGGSVFALLLAVFVPHAQRVDASAIISLATTQLEPQWWVMVISGFFAGFLMGFLSWLLIAARETISQLVFVWMIATTLGFAHLHHSIAGAIEVMAALLLSEDIGGLDFGRFLLWATLGNIMGSIFFALLIRFGTFLSGSGKGSTA